MRDGETVASIQMRAEQDASRFLDQRGSLAAELQWTPGDLFDVPRDGKPAVPAKNAQTVKAREPHIVNGLTPDFSHGLQEIRTAPIPSRASAPHYGG